MLTALLRGAATLYALLMALFMVGPTAVVVIGSFTSATYMVFPPPGYGLRWYAALLNSPVWLQAGIASLQVAAVSAVVATALGTTIAFGLARGRLPLKNLINAVVLGPLIVPVMLIAVGVYVVCLRLHVVGTLAAFVAADSVLAVPFVVISVTASLRNVDRNLEMAAAGLGARPLRTLFTITLPLIVPGVLAGSLFAFLTAWDETVIAIFLSTDAYQTLPVVIWGALRYGVDPSVASASTVITLLSFVVLASLLAVRPLWSQARRG